MVIPKYFLDFVFFLMESGYNIVELQTLGFPSIFWILCFFFQIGSDFYCRITDIWISKYFLDFVCFLNRSVLVVFQWVIRFSSIFCIQVFFSIVKLQTYGFPSIISIFVFFSKPLKCFNIAIIKYFLYFVFFFRFGISNACCLPVL